MERPKDVALDPAPAGGPLRGEAEAGLRGPGPGRDAHLAPAGLRAAWGDVWERGRWGWGGRA